MLSKEVLGFAPAVAWILGLAGLGVIRWLFLRHRKGLSKYNGPFLASFTDLWRTFHAYANKNRPPMLDLHRKYGGMWKVLADLIRMLSLSNKDIVRIGPNTLSFGNPDAINDIYGPGKAWNKVRAC